MANITDLKYTAEDLEELLEFYKSIGNVQGTAELAAMLARVQDKIAQFEEADGLLDDAEELLERYGPDPEAKTEIDPDFETPY